VDVVGGERLIISNNQILDSDGAGLRLEGVKHSLVTGNLIRDDREADKRSKEPALVDLTGEGNLIEGNLIDRR